LPSVFILPFDSSAFWNSAIEAVGQMGFGDLGLNPKNIKSATI
jgi:hypothetical protein